MNLSEIFYFSSFIIFVLGLIIIDLLIFRKPHEPSLKETIISSSVWISMGLLMYFVVLNYGDRLHGITNIEDLKNIVSKYKYDVNIDESNYAYSISLFKRDMAMKYITGYLLEEMLSIDNLFVMFMIFTSFGIDAKYYKKVLFYGILGAIIFRFIFIFAGVALVQRFEWILYVFGGVLVVSGLKMFFNKKEEDSIDKEKNIVYRYLFKFFSVSDDLTTHKFFIRKDGRLHITYLFITLIIIELSDIIFAFDSIPAIFSITIDPYIVMFSNVFAILGLRSLYFLLIRMIKKFYLLSYGIAILLIFVGFKLIFRDWLHSINFGTVYSLLFILFVFVFSIFFSLLIKPKSK